MYFRFILLSVYLISQISGHGYLADPPARSSAWLFDKDFLECCKYYDHNQMFCGGQYRQWTVNKGRCSVCGEAADSERKLFGMGDAMYTGKIVRTYKQGSIIPITVVLTANHLGIFQFRVCSLDENPAEDATQSCLDANVLQIDSISTDYPIESSDRTVHVNVTLPSTLVCAHCVFQWKYRTGNSWGTANGKSCLGCGRENEEFYGCADIAIVGEDQPIPVTPDNIEEIVDAVEENTTKTEPVSTGQRTCGSAVTFSSSFDLYNVIDQYCQSVCSSYCASDNKPGNELLYKGCINSCDKLCACT